MSTKWIVVEILTLILKASSLVFYFPRSPFILEPENITGSNIFPPSSISISAEALPKLC